MLDQKEFNICIFSFEAFEVKRMFFATGRNLDGKC